MPLYLNAGLPGPFRVVKRLDGRGTARFVYVLCVAWWYLPLKWTVLGLAWLTVQSCRWGCQAYRGWRGYRR